MIEFTTDSGAGIQGHHDPLLAGLSLVLALLAAYAALIFHERIAGSASPARVRIWLWVGAAVLGLGIWSMHFIGMLAYVLPLPVSYAVTPTVASLLPAMLGSAYLLRIISSSGSMEWEYVLGGVVFGVGVGGMHYAGMAAMELTATLRYDAALFVMSLGVSICLGVIAVYSLRHGTRRDKRSIVDIRYVVVALIMAVAISGMHYTAMAAVYFVPSSAAAVGNGGSGHGWLAYAAGGGGAFVALMALAVAFVDRRLEASAALVRTSRERLLGAISAMRDGFILMDARGRILMVNPALAAITGHTEAALIGRHAARMALCDSREVRREIVGFLAETGALGRRGYRSKGAW